jgi:bilirubin oxidase
VELSGKTGLPVLPSERYDIIVDFTGVKPGTKLYLSNEGAAATVGTTGTAMRFNVVPLKSKDTSVPPRHLVLPSYFPPFGSSNVRRVSLSEQTHNGQLALVTEYMCGTVDSSGLNTQLDWSDPVTEKPAYGTTETWQVYNFSGEGSAQVSHVFHMHLVQFQVISRQSISGGSVQGPHPWETGPKDSCDAPTGLITTVKAHFDRHGLFVWHCHLLDHEDNSMMRPMQVV